MHYDENDPQSMLYKNLFGLEPDTSTNTGQELKEGNSYCQKVFGKSKDDLLNYLEKNYQKKKEEDDNDIGTQLEGGRMKRQILDLCILGEQNEDSLLYLVQMVNYSYNQCIPLEQCVKCYPKPKENYPTYKVKWSDRKCWQV